MTEVVPSPPPQLTGSGRSRAVKKYVVAGTLAEDLQLPLTSPPTHHRQAKSHERYGSERGLDSRPSPDSSPEKILVHLSAMEATTATAHHILLSLPPLQMPLVDLAPLPWRGGESLSPPSLRALPASAGEGKERQEWLEEGGARVAPMSLAGATRSGSLVSCSLHYCTIT